MSERNIYSFLDRVRKRPSMYLSRKGTESELAKLECNLIGYYQALHEHGILEDCPQLTQSHFLSWLRIKKWSEPLGWAFAIEHHCPEGQEPLDVFFELVDEYRQLKFNRRLHIRLKEHHEPTRARAKIGIDKKIEKPTKVTLCSYDPAELFFFIFDYEDRPVVQHILFDNGKTQTSLGYAKKWALDELQIQENEWQE